jgi:hypothetical protein
MTFIRPFVTAIALVLSMGVANAADPSTAAYCSRIAGGSYVLEKTCQQQEEQARAALASRNVEPRIRSYCERIARDSQVLLQTCIDQEEKAKQSVLPATATAAASATIGDASKGDPGVQLCRDAPLNTPAGDPKRTAMVFWAVGFVNGTMHGRGDQRWVYVKDENIDGIMKGLTSYCGSNPNETLAAAVIATTKRILGTP